VIGGDRPDQILQGRAPGQGDLLPVAEPVDQPRRTELTGPPAHRRPRFEPGDQRFGQPELVHQLLFQIVITTGVVQDADLDDPPLAGRGQHAGHVGTRGLHLVRNLLLG
jgi:hypothetical protein